MFIFSSIVSYASDDAHNVLLSNNLLPEDSRIAAIAKATEQVIFQNVKNAAEQIKNIAKNTVQNGHTPDLTDPMGQYPVALATDLNLGVGEALAPTVNVVVQGLQNVAKNTVQNGKTPDLTDPMGQYPVGLETTPSFGITKKVASFIQEYKKSTEEMLKNSAKLQNNTAEQAWYNKAWNAEIAGYQGAGKYVIVGSTVVATALLTAYYLGCFSKTVSIAQMVDNLIAQAQENPNIVIVELPKILALCEDEQMEKNIFKYVLSNVVLTAEIKKAFNC